MIILNTELAINCKKERMEARRQGRKLLQLYKQKKKKYSSLKPSVGGDEEKRSGSGYILERESTDLDNRLYMKERDGKARNDSQVWGLSSCVDGDSLSQRPMKKSRSGRTMFPMGEARKGSPSGTKLQSLILLFLTDLHQSSKGAHTFYTKFHHQKISSSQ